jgi:hypothetical protein
MYEKSRRAFADTVHAPTFPCRCLWVRLLCWTAFGERIPSYDRSSKNVGHAIQRLFQSSNGREKTVETEMGKWTAELIGKTYFDLYSR